MNRWVGLATAVVNNFPTPTSSIAGARQEFMKATEATWPKMPGSGSGRDPLTCMPIALPTVMVDQGSSQRSLTMRCWKRAMPWIAEELCADPMTPAVLGPAGRPSMRAFLKEPRLAVMPSASRTGLRVGQPLRRFQSRLSRGGQHD